MDGYFRFTINEREYSLYFGMAAIRFYSQKIAEEMMRLSDGKPTPETIQEISGFKGFFFIVYAGLFGNADIEQSKMPSYKEAYNLTEEILFSGEELQAQITDAYINSRATQNQLKSLGIQKKSPEVNSKTSTGTRKKATSTPS